MRAVLALFVACLGLAAGAETVDRSPRPLPNPALGAVPAVAPAVAPAAVAATSAGEGALARSLRPEPRPAALGQRIAALSATAPAEGLDLSSTPEVAEPEPAAVARPMTRAERRAERRRQRAAQSMEGAVCGVPGIKGEEIAPITSRTRGCGVADAVRVTSVAGVRLSQAATVECSIAQALNSWVDEVAQPAFDGQLVELQIAAHYVCRSRNNKRGAPISEHGKGRAVDISGFVLSSGRVLTVSDDFNRVLRKIYRAGCGYFRTTLGPGSDGYHENHFHFDTAVRNGGPYCG